MIFSKTNEKLECIHTSFVYIGNSTCRTATLSSKDISSRSWGLFRFWFCAVTSLLLFCCVVLSARSDAINFKIGAVCCAVGGLVGVPEDLGGGGKLSGNELGCVDLGCDLVDIGGVVGDLGGGVVGDLVCDLVDLDGAVGDLGCDLVDLDGVVDDLGGGVVGDLGGVLDDLGGGVGDLGSAPGDLCAP